MNCEACNDLLMDLLYDELDEVRSAAVRKHLEGCASCTAAWQRVSRGRSLAATLEPVTAPLPSPSLLAALEAAAKELQGAARSSQATAATGGEPRSAGGGEGVAPVSALDHAPRRLPTWLHRLGDLAMRRQVAMAAVVFLSMGVVWKFVPSHAPSTLDTAVEATAPEVIPARELPTTPEAVRPTTTAVTPSRMRGSAAPRGGADHRVARTESPAALPPAPATPERARDEREALRAEEGPADNALAPTPAASAAAGDTPGREVAAYRAQAPSSAGLGTNIPGGIPATDRDLARALPPAPGMAAPMRSGYGAAEAQSHRGETESAIAAYRAALEADPPEAERTRIARALVALLLREGRVTEVETVRARYLRPAPTREAAAQVDDAPPSSLPHVGTQRPARRAVPSTTNVLAY